MLSQASIVNVIICCGCVATLVAHWFLMGGWAGGWALGWTAHGLRFQTSGPSNWWCRWEGKRDTPPFRGTGSLRWGPVEPPAIGQSPKPPGCPIAGESTSSGGRFIQVLVTNPTQPPHHQKPAPEIKFTNLK